MEHSLPSLEALYTLKQAAGKFFPNGPLTAASLRNEIRKGRLQATMPAGKLFERAAIAGVVGVDVAAPEGLHGGVAHRRVGASQPGVRRDHVNAVADDRIGGLAHCS